MGRKLRVQYSGAIYHVMNRGDRREPIFDDDLDRQRFLQTLAEACAKTDWQVHAWCLMGNHFHLVIETPQPNLVLGMKWFLGTYTSRFNPAAQALWPSIQWPLQGDGRGRQRQRLSQDRVRLCSSQPGAGQTAPPRGSHCAPSGGAAFP